MKTVSVAKPGHMCQRVMTLEIATPREGNLRIGVSHNHTHNGSCKPSLIQNLHFIHSQHIKVQILQVGHVAKNLGVSEPWSSTREPNGRQLPNWPTAKC